MGELLKKAFETLKILPDEDRERIALEIIERVEDKAEWDRIVSAPNSQQWLGTQAKKALREYGKISNKLSLTFISIPQGNLLREESYWKNFDELPSKIRKLAEKNYQLWKENPQYPGLRFKKIHAESPIFSFRVGMQHRTVGVETNDGKIAWFWIGSFEQFERQINL